MDDKDYAKGIYWRKFVHDTDQTTVINNNIDAAIKKIKAAVANKKSILKTRSTNPSKQAKRKLKDLKAIHRYKKSKSKK